MESEERAERRRSKDALGLRGRGEKGRGRGEMDEWERKEGGEEGGGKERARGVGGGVMMN